jgi:preprotein translocase subunit YajC
MILKEGDKVKKTESGIVYEVKKVHDKGFVILSSEDGSRTALMNMKDVDLYFSLIPLCVTGS